MRILVTDATYKHTLAAVRSLGKRGITVFVGGSRRFGQAYFSKYCAGKLVYQNPYDEAAFVQQTIEFVQKHKIDVVLPIGYQPNIVLSRHKMEVEAYARLPLADWPVMQVACDMSQTMTLAGRLRIPMPQLYNDKREVRRYPVVVKNMDGSGKFQYVNSEYELAGIDTSHALIQEYIPGDTYGFFALFDRGVCKAFFMHRKRREYPVTGGASTAAESTFSARLKEWGLTLLEGIQWHGVVMAEFKKDRRDGEFKLMEISPRFWDSLDLAISCGVDFPYLAAKMAAGEQLGGYPDYLIGRRFRWLFPEDLMHVLARPSSLGPAIADLFSRTTRSNWSWSDIKPCIFQTLASVPIILSRLISGHFRRPHGLPRMVR